MLGRKIDESTFKDALFAKLSSADAINDALNARQSIFIEGKPVDLSTADANQLFDARGNWVDKPNTRFDKKRINAFLVEMLGSQDIVNIFTDREKIIIEAVCNKIIAELELEYTNQIISAAPKGIISSADAGKIAGAKAHLARLLQGALFQAHPYIKSYLINNPGIYPGATEPTSAADYLPYVRRVTNWDYYFPPELHTRVLHGRIFKSCPTPPYLFPLLNELTDIIQHQDHLQENLQIWLNKLERRAYADLFDNDGNIREELLNVLPTFDPPLDRRDEDAKKLLFHAYFTGFITENVTAILDKSEYREHMLTMVKEIRRRIDVRGTGLEHEDEVENPAIAVVNQVGEHRNQQILRSPFAETQARCLSPQQDRPYTHDAPKPRSTEVIATESRRRRPSGAGSDDEGPMQRARESAQTQPPRPGFFSRNKKTIIASTISGATVGAAIGAGIGVVMGFFAAPFTLGFSIPAFAGICAGIGAAVGAGLGFGISAIACKVSESRDKKRVAKTEPARVDKVHDRQAQQRSVEPALKKNPKPLFVPAPPKNTSPRVGLESQQEASGDHSLPRPGSPGGSSSDSGNH